VKKLYGVTLSLLLTILTFAVSVYAWFSFAHNNAQTTVLTGSAIDGVASIDGDKEKVDLFLGSDLRNLSYLSESDFEEDANFLKGLASVVKITINNTNDVDVFLKLQLRTIFATEYGDLSGDIDSLKYFIIEESTTFEQVYQEIKNLSSNTFYNNMDIFNANQKINMDAAIGSTPTEKDLYIYVWGDFDQLTENQKTNLQFISYRISLSIRLVGENA